MCQGQQNSITGFGVLEISGSITTTIRLFVTYFALRFTLQYLHHNISILFLHQRVLLRFLVNFCAKFFNVEKFSTVQKKLTVF